mgnify:CR=1 FL=1
MTKSAARKESLEESSDDDASTESDNSCKANHNDLRGSFKEENDSGYFKKGFDMFGTSCIECKVQFKPLKDGKCYVVNRKQSVFVCVGRNKYQCKHALCMKCYNDK